MKKLFIEELQEDYSSEDVKAFLDEVGGYTDYDGKVEELMDYFGMTKDQAESAIQDYVTSPDDDDDDFEENLNPINEDSIDDKPWNRLDSIHRILNVYDSANDKYQDHIVSEIARLAGFPDDSYVGSLDPDDYVWTKISDEKLRWLDNVTRLTDANRAKDEDLEEAVSDLSHPEQEFDSAATSINSSKLPAIYKMVNFNEGDVVIDFGGGRFDNAVEYIKDKGATLVVYDPYNRSAEHNEQVLATLEENGGADAAVNSNVLNVIKEPEARQAVLQNIKKLLKPGAPVYITVYEGRGDGVEGPTKSGYQLNRKTEGYLDEVREVFPDAIRKGKLIVATNR